MKNRNKKIVIIVMAITLITIAGLYVGLPRQDFPMYLDIDRVDYEPEHYFVLDEEMGGVYPILRSVLDKMELKETRSASRVITLEEMDKLMKVVPYGSFRYEDNFYELGVIVV